MYVSNMFWIINFIINILADDYKFQADNVLEKNVPWKFGFFFKNLSLFLFESKVFAKSVENVDLVWGRCVLKYWYICI